MSKEKLCEHDYNYDPNDLFWADDKHGVYNLSAEQIKSLSNLISDVYPETEFVHIAEVAQTGLGPILHAFFVKQENKPWGRKEVIGEEDITDVSTW